MLNKIKEYRLELGWSIGTLSRISGVDYNYVKRLENQTVKSPGLETCVRISLALGKSILQIFSPINDKESQRIVEDAITQYLEKQRKQIGGSKND
ncbi:helix-turn-helix protein [compost metagenome]